MRDLSETTEKKEKKFKFSVEMTNEKILIQIEMDLVTYAVFHEDIAKLLSGVCVPK